MRCFGSRREEERTSPATRSAAPSVAGVSATDAVATLGADAGSTLTALREYLRRLWGAFRRQRTDCELECELRFHLEEAVEELRRKGHSPAEALRLARARLGGLPQTMEALRDQRGFPWIDDVQADMRIGVRCLAQRRGFAATAVLTLSIGIGATAAVATVTNALLFHPLPVPDPDELVVVAQLDEHTAEFPHGVSYPEYLDYRERSDVFEGLAAHTSTEELLSIDGGAAERIWIEYVSDNYFDVLQVDAERGRTFLPGEGREPGDVPFVVLTHRAWRTRFGGNPAAVGRVVRLGPVNMVVIGVTPEAFVGTNGLVPTELFVLATEGARVEPGWTGLSTNRLPESFVLTGRLRPDATVAEAAAQLHVLADALAAEHPDASRHTELYVVAERRARPIPGASRHTTPLVIVVMGLASLVLLLAVANVGTLAVVRGVARRQEMALRAGLGATRWRLVRQLVTESVLLALMGGAGGGIMALWVADLVIATVAMATGMEQLIFESSVDWRVFGFTATITIAAGVLAGLPPALRSTRIDLARTIGSGGHGSSGGAPGRRLTNGLVVMQVAVSMVLLVCAGLFVQSGRNADAIDVGFRTDDLLVLSVDPLAQGYDPEQARGLYRDVVDDVGALPGVRSASWARRAPVSQGGSSGSVFTLDGGTAPEPDAAVVAVNYVDPGFFDTVGIPVIRGRGFREEDATGDRRVVLVSERAARQLWPGRDAIGRRIVNTDTDGAPFEVIGVTRDAHMSRSPFDRPPFVLYPFRSRLTGPATLHVHIEAPSSAVASMVTETIRRHDPTLAVFDAGSMNAVVRSMAMLVGARVGAAAIGSFGVLGLLLAVVGLYGVVSYAAAQRKQEFGIRTAVGATSAALTRLALGRGVVLTTVGLILGAVAAAGAGRLAAGFLVEVRSSDPVVFAVVGALLAGAALLACLVPAWRAARTDPLATLRAG